MAMATTLTFPQRLEVYFHDMQQGRAGDCFYNALLSCLREANLLALVLGDAEADVCSLRRAVAHVIRTWPAARDIVRNALKLPIDGGFANTPLHELAQFLASEEAGKSGAAADLVAAYERLGQDFCVDMLAEITAASSKYAWQLDFQAADVIMQQVGVSLVNVLPTDLELRQSAAGMDARVHASALRTRVDAIIRQHGRQRRLLMLSTNDHHYKWVSLRTVYAHASPCSDDHDVLSEHVACVEAGRLSDTLQLHQLGATRISLCMMMSSSHARAD